MSPLAVGSLIAVSIVFDGCIVNDLMMMMMMKKKHKTMDTLVSLNILFIAAVYRQKFE